MTGQRPNLIIVRRITAAPAKVWAAITEPELMMQWWVPMRDQLSALWRMFVRAAGSV